MCFGLNSRFFILPTRNCFKVDKLKILLKYSVKLVSVQGLQPVGDRYKYKI